MKIEKKEDRNWQESGSLYIAMDENFRQGRVGGVLAGRRGKGFEGKRHAFGVNSALRGARDVYPACHHERP